MAYLWARGARSRPTRHGPQSLSSRNGPDLFHVDAHRRGGPHQPKLLPDPHLPPGRRLHAEGPRAVNEHSMADFRMAAFPAAAGSPTIDRDDLFGPRSKELVDSPRECPGGSAIAHQEPDEEHQGYA